jgi:hypothetical protein
MLHNFLLSATAVAVALGLNEMRRRRAGEVRVDEHDHCNRLPGRKLTGSEHCPLLFTNICSLQIFT